MDQQAPITTSDSDAPPARGKRATFIGFGIGLLLLAAACTAYFLHARQFATTDDAFIDGHISQISAETAGRVIHLYVNDNETVTAGQILLDIDPRDATLKLQQAEAERAQAQAVLEQARATLAVRQADASQAGANADASNADLAQADQNLARLRRINPRAITKQELDTATTSARAAQARLAAAHHLAAGSRAQIIAAKAAIDADSAAMQTADAAVAVANLTLLRTKLVAPAAGRVARRTVELGNYITTGQPLLAIVQPDLWVTANFKETQLALMHPGQDVTLDVDAYPAANLHGHIESLQSGTGSIFSALPSENATGNYVKVVQRLPVKIVFDGDDWRNLGLSPGMSVFPRVRVR